MTTRHLGGCAFGAAVLAAFTTVADGQNVVTHDRAVFVSAGGGGAHVVDVSTGGDIPAIEGQAFSGEATTEFVQVLADGNRIERRSTVLMWRDSQGRTRREQEVPFDAPFMMFSAGGPSLPPPSPAAGDPRGQPTRLIVIHDPVEGVTYTLDERSKIARRVRHVSDGRPVQLFLTAPAMGAPINVLPPAPGAQPQGGVTFEAAVAMDSASSHDGRTESLGSADVEGVAATGQRTTMTMPAGAIGNVLPIEVLTERWYSPQLQIPVRVTVRDPRMGETTYRVTNLVRAEPPADLFAVPPDYQVQDITMPTPFTRQLNAGPPAP